MAGDSKSTRLDFATPPSLEDIEAIAAAAYQTIPAELTQHARNIVIHIGEFPDDETLAEMGFESPFDLMGLYRGVDLSRKSIGDVVQDIDMIFLYRRPLLDYWCESGEDLAHLIRHVLIHEIGHHFGLSDEDMERIEDAAEEI
ncbi:MAG: metallopeptidase family protein, partial [Pseudomonadota bacterium]